MSQISGFSQYHFRVSSRSFHILSEKVNSRSCPGLSITCPGLRGPETRVEVLLLGARHPLAGEDLPHLPELDHVVLTHCGQQTPTRVKIQMLYNTPKTFSC